jgi:hypothetical protein
MTGAQLRLRFVERMTLASARALAVGLHPLAAWRRRPGVRAPMVVGYAVASYMFVLWALMAF